MVLYTPDLLSNHGDANLAYCKFTHAGNLKTLWSRMLTDKTGFVISKETILQDSLSKVCILTLRTRNQTMNIATQIYRRFTLTLLNSLQFRLSFNSFKENLLTNVP